MRKFLQSLLLIAAFALPWVSNAQTDPVPDTVPFHCNFEDTALHSQWVFVNYANSGGTPTLVYNHFVISYDTAANSTANGTYALYITDDEFPVCSTCPYTYHYKIGSSAAGDVAYVQGHVYAYRDIYFPEAGDYDVEYNWKSNGEVHFDFARVCLAPSTFVFNASVTGWDSTTTVPGQYFGNHTVPQGFIPLDNGAELSGHSTWQHMSTSVTIPAAGVYRFVVLWRNDGNIGEEPTITVDDISIVRQTCQVARNLTISNLKTTSATLSWDSTGAAGWILEWDVATASSYSNSVYLTVPHYNFSNLTAGGSYKARIRVVCGVDDSSHWASYAFSTPSCAFLTSLPYTIDFDNDVTNYGSYSTPPDIPCWSHVNNGTYNSYPYLISSSTYAHTGTRSLYWYYQTGSAYYDPDATVALPGIDRDSIDLQHVVVNFWAAASSITNPVKWYIGVSADPWHVAAFEIVDSIETNSTTPVEYHIPLTTYNGNGNFIVIRNGMPSNGLSYSYGYMDDVSLTYEPCARTIIRDDSIFAATAHFSWTNYGALYYEYAADSAHFTSPNTVYDTVLHLSGLMGNRVYTFYLRSVCTCGAGEWVAHTFRTACGDTELPFFDSFEDAEIATNTDADFTPYCWNRWNNSPVYFYPHVVSEGVSNSHSGTRSVYWYNATGSDYGDCQVITLPYTSHSVDSLMLSFWVKPRYTEYRPDFIIGVMTDPDSLHTFVAVDSVRSATSQWEIMEVPLTAYQGNGHYVAIRANRPLSGWSAYIDDVTLDFTPTCFHPVDITLDSATPSSLTFHWSGPANGAHWIVTVDSNSYSSYDTVFTATNLAAGCSHDVTVQAICSVTDSSTIQTTSFFTACAEIYPSDLPIVESFEDYTASSNADINPCWNRWVAEMGMMTQGPHYMCSVVSYESHNGSKSLNMQASVRGMSFMDRYSMLVLPRIADSISQMMIEFWLGGMEGDLALGYLTNPTDISTFQSLATFTTQMGSWTRNEYYFNNLSDSIHYIAFSSNLTTNRYADFNIDDIALKPMPTCFPPSTVQLVNATTDSLVITWPAENSSEWIVEINSTTNHVTDTVFAIGGLNANTEYAFRIASYCSGDTSAWSETSFRTACADATLPYFENFDNATTSTSYNLNMDPPCYSYHMLSANPIYTDVNYKPTVYFGMSHSGNYSVNLRGESYFVLPEMPAPADSLYMSFWAHSNTYQYVLEVGVIDNNDEFHPVTQLSLDNGFNQYEVSFADYNGPDGRLAFHNFYLHYSQPSTSIYLDDIAVDYIASCATPSIRLSDLTENTAAIAIDGSTAANYQVEYGAAGFGHGNGTVVAVTGTTTLIANLTSGTAYQAYVRAICSAGDTSAWSRPVDFTPYCSPVSIPYTENFDSLTANTFPDCWSYTLTNSYYSSVSYAPKVYSSSSYVTSSPYCLRLYGFSYTCLPMMSVPLDSLQLTFSNGVSSTGYALEVGVMEGTTFIPIEDISYTTTGPQAPHTVYFNGYTGPSRVIAFRNHLPYNEQGGYSYQYIDDVIVDYAPACLPPAISAENITTTQATLHLNGTATTQFEVEYGYAGFDRGTGSFATPSTDSVVLANLTSSTTYDVYARTFCASGDTSDWASLTFTTQCGNITELPFMEGFDDCLPNAIGTLPPCWSKEASTQPTNSYASNYFAYSGANSYRLWYYDSYGIGDHSCLALPSVAVSLDSLELSLMLYCSNSATGYGDVTVGVMTDPNDYSTFEPVETVSNHTPSTWEKRVVSFENYTGTGRYPAIVAAPATASTQSVENWIDEIILDYRHCVIDVTIDSITTTTASIDWTDSCSSTAWEVEYGTGVFAHGQGTTVQTQTHPIALTGLNSSSNYTVYVRPYSTEGTGSWSQAAYFATDCAPISTPYVQNFEDCRVVGSIGDVMGDLPNCWEPQNISGSSYDLRYNSHITANGSHWYTRSGNKSLSMMHSTSGSECAGVARLPEFADPVNSLRLSFWFCTEFDATQCGSLEVGYLTSPDFSTFVTVKSIPSSPATVHSGVGRQTNAGLLDTVTFDTVTDSARYIAFRWVCNSASTSVYYCCLDDITVTTICQKPIVSSIDRAYNGATISWIGNADNCEVAVKAAADSDWPAATAVQGNTYTFTGLEAETQYTFRVRQICDASSISNWTEGTFTTNPLPCFTPTGLELVAENGLAAVLDWTAAEGQSNWEVALFNTTFSQTYPCTAHPAYIVDLTAGETYYATVRSICDSTDYSDWSDTITFTTSVCDPVTNVSASVNGTSATLSWTPGTNNSGQWEIEYGLRGFSQGEGTTVQVSANNATISNLMSETSYDAYVRAICGPGYISTWSDKVTFTTEHIGINHVEGQMNVSIYPNPANGSTTISLSGVDGLVNIEIVDMNGRTVLTDAMECQGDCEKKLTVSNLAQGAYFVRIYSDEVNTVKKLIVR